VFNWLREKIWNPIIDTWTCAPIMAFLSFHEILSTRPIYGEVEKISRTRQKNQAGKSDK
jgi:hypothetical protein